jgi:sugar phosphate permease
VVVLGLTRLGWRWTAFLSGVLILLVGLPLSHIVRRHRPEAYGLEPDGDPAATLEVGAAMRPRPAPVDFTPREAMRAPALWLIAAGHGAALLVVSAVMVHFVTDVTERLGFSLRQAATIVALMTVVQIAGQLGGGFAGDRFSKRAIVVGCMAAHAIALFVLASATALWMVVVFAVLHGLAWGVRGPLMAALRADYFGSASFGMITGISSMVVMIGMMAGPLVAGIIADRTGSYQTGFRVLAGCAALGSVFFLLARRPEPPHRAPAGVPQPALSASARASQV